MPMGGVGRRCRLGMLSGDTGERGGSNGSGCGGGHVSDRCVPGVECLVCVRRYRHGQYIGCAFCDRVRVAGLMGIGSSGRAMKGHADRSGCGGGFIKIWKGAGCRRRGVQDRDAPGRECCTGRAGKVGWVASPFSHVGDVREVGGRDRVDRKGRRFAAGRAQKNRVSFPTSCFPR